MILNIDPAMKNSKYYNGNTPKIGITVNNVDYIVKLPKSGLSVYSEYVASNFIRGLGVPCQKVYLGNYKGFLVNVIEDFTSENSFLHSFKDTKQSSEDTDISAKNYTYKDVVYLIDKHVKMSDEEKIKAKGQFWDMFICDAILGNRDRHWGNWGYLVSGSNYVTAPIYDNGASLFPGVEKTIKDYINIETRIQFLKDRVFKFPASLFMIEKPDRCYRTNYYDMFSDLRFNRVYAERVKLFRGRNSVNRISSLSNELILKNMDLIGLSSYIRRFYFEIILLRYMCIVRREDFERSYRYVEGVLKNV